MILQTLYFIVLVFSFIMIFKHFLKKEHEIYDKLIHPRSRGDLGEQILSELLEQAGFMEGQNYLVKHKTEDGKIPDITIILPKNTLCHIDAKFPLQNYREWLVSKAPEHMKAFKKDIRDPVKEISEKYIDSDTLPFAILFLPNDNLLAIILEHDEEYIKYCLQHRVIVTTPCTLYAVLSIIFHLSSLINLDATLAERVLRFGEVDKEWDKYKEEMQKVEKNIDSLHASFLSLKGVRTKKLDKALNRI
jgi:DNA recombination protein RmuC